MYRHYNDVIMGPMASEITSLTIVYSIVYSIFSMCHILTLNAVGTVIFYMCGFFLWEHYADVIMGPIASQITSLTIVYSIVYSDADQRKHQSSASLAFVWGIHRDRWIPRTWGRLRGKCFHLMTSSWMMFIQPTLHHLRSKYKRRSHIYMYMWVMRNPWHKSYFCPDYHVSYVFFYQALQPR